MSVRSWMLLLFLLSAGSSLADVDVNWLTRIVEIIKTEYKIKGQFCLAANIPLNLDSNTLLLQVLQNDRYEGHVESTVEDGDVYKGTNVVIAKHAGPVHAEPRVLNNLESLRRNSEGRVLLIYSLLSPCDKCVWHHKFKITKDIQTKVLPYWGDYAFVFETVFDQPKFGENRTPEEVKESLEELGNSGLGLRNIFRCYEPQNLEFQCHSCSSQGRVSNVCIDNKAVPQQGGSRSRSSDRRSSDRRSSDRSSSDRRSSSRNSNGVSSRKRGRYSPNESSSSRDRSS